MYDDQDIEDDVNFEFKKQSLSHTTKICNPHTTEKQEESCKNFVSELLSLLEHSRVQTIMLPNIHTALKSLISECKGLINVKDTEEILTLGKYVPPNQKLISK